MRVLVVSEHWWPEGTGGILASYLITRILRDAGFKLTVVHGTKLAKPIEGVRFVYSNFLNVRNKYGLWLSCSALSRQSWFLEILRKSDVVYIPRYCYPLIPFAKKLGKKVIVHLHDYQPISYSATVLNNSIDYESVRESVKFEILEHQNISRAILGGFVAHMNKLGRLWLRRADTIICVSNRQAEIISTYSHELANKIRVIYNPLPNTQPIEKELEDFTFLYLGGDSYVKGFHVFLKASYEVAKRHRDVKFVLTRSLSRKNEIRLKALNNKLSRNAYHMLGHIRHEDVMRLYSKACALLFPSIWEEPMPYAVMESMLAGTIPIASRVGGVPEMIQGSYAEKILFAPGDADELIDRMEKVMSLSKGELMEIGISLRESAFKRFNVDVIKDQILNVFQC